MKPGWAETRNEARCEARQPGPGGRGPSRAKAMAEGLAQAAVERAEIKAQAATERAEIIRRQAWHLYIVVSTIAVASVSIWIALLTQSGAGG